MNRTVILKIFVANSNGKISMETVYCSFVFIFEINIFIYHSSPIMGTILVLGLLLNFINPNFLFSYFAGLSRYPNKFVDILPLLLIAFNKLVIAERIKSSFLLFILFQFI
ncbi:hypothetical protein BpHYR1_016211 [Brachionus plicatilis]|uniref:Uncharacterized protein n=1 Tax=Brachionus plicatilis TaxID=10195 RepID=A0A3M7RHL9_BRAPC|nr:hypothetical protein BpHYR1_016211 [Brachionus plicatilis]